MESRYRFARRDAPPAHEAEKHCFHFPGQVVRTTAKQIVPQGIGTRDLSATTRV